MVDAQTRTQFVGRERELRELLDALDTSRAGHGRIVLIGGEPGIGKSRLADELASIATEQGQLVLWGRAWEDAGAPAYWPWVQALRTLIRSSTPDQVRRYLGLGAPDVAQMLPELGAMFPDLSPPSGAESESARFQLFDSTTNLLRNAADDRPMLIVLDDLHAADTPTVLLLRFLVSQLTDMAALVVGTYRDLELTPDHPLTLAIGEMARERSTRLVMLGGLGSGAVSEYISATANFQLDELTVRRGLARNERQPTLRRRGGQAARGRGASSRGRRPDQPPRGRAGRCARRHRPSHRTPERASWGRIDGGRGDRP